MTNPRVVDSSYFNLVCDDNKAVVEYSETGAGGQIRTVTLMNPCETEVIDIKEMLDEGFLKAYENPASIMERVWSLVALDEHQREVLTVDNLMDGLKESYEEDGNPEQLYRDAAQIMWETDPHEDWGSGDKLLRTFVKHTVGCLEFRNKLECLFDHRREVAATTMGRVGKVLYQMLYYDVEPLDVVIQ